jgi:5-methyltetrahydrofolate--homocysteine methyltransferase
MIIVGERLNSSRQPVFRALDKKDEKFIVDEAKRQEKAGAGYIDVNTAALLDKEIETLRWAVPLLQKVLKVPLSIDTPNPEAMKEGLSLHKGQALLNSLTGEKERIKTFLPLIKEHKPQVIVLCLDESGLPKSLDKELSVAQKMVDLLEKEGLRAEDIFIDPLVRPIGVDQNAAGLFLESLEKIKRKLPDVKTIAGISNVSFGLPKRSLLNRTFLTLALSKGLDAAILDPLDKKIFPTIRSTQALLGKDPSLKNYLAYIRENKT